MATATFSLGLVLAPGAFALALLPMLLRHRSFPTGMRLLALGTLVWILPPLLRWAPGELLHDLQVVAMVLIVAAASRVGDRDPATIAAAISGGLALLALIGLLQLGGFASSILAPFVGSEGVARLAEQSRAALASGRASGWLDHPNLWATRVLVPSMFVLALPTGPRWRVVALVPALIVVLSAGSRATLLGLGSGLLLLALLSLMRNPGVRRLALMLLALTAITALALLPPWGTRVRALFDLLAPESATLQPSHNLFVSSSDLTDASWFERGVEVERRSGGERAEWVVRKTLEGSSNRLQQRIELPPGEYVLSAELLATDPAARPGLLAFWRDRSGEVHSLNAHRVEGEWKTNGRGSLALLWLEVTALEDGWLHLDLGIRNTAAGPLIFPVGPTPDQRDVIGAEIGVRDLQLSAGASPRPYQATAPPDRARIQAQASAQGRGRIFAAAWRGFLLRPLLGHGDGAFSSWFRRWIGNDGVTVGHAHNLLLQTLFARGVVGVLGLALLLLGLVVSARGAPGFLIVLSAVLVANLFDATFWNPAQSYLLAVAAGWYAGRAAPRTPVPPAPG